MMTVNRSLLHQFQTRSP